MTANSIFGSGSNPAVFRWASLTLIALAFLPRPCSAYDFRPTEAEWRVWPDYCRAKYVGTSIGRTSDFTARVSEADVQRWEASMGESWFALHHFCAGLAKVDRAARMPTRQARDTEYGRAIGEFVFFIERTPETHPMYAEAAVRIGLAKDRVGATEEGIKYCDLATRAQVTNPIGYIGKATLYRRHKDLERAREVLELGHKETGGKSAELEYSLGLVYADLKDYPKAVKHAAAAYSLGYPLPGLRDRLSAAGYALP